MWPLVCPTTKTPPARTLFPGAAAKIRPVRQQPRAPGKLIVHLQRHGHHERRPCLSRADGQMRLRKHQDCQHFLCVVMRVASAFLPHEVSWVPPWKLPRQCLGVLGPPRSDTECWDCAANFQQRRSIAGCPAWGYLYLSLKSVEPARICRFADQFVLVEVVSKS